MLTRWIYFKMKRFIYFYLLFLIFSTESLANVIGSDNQNFNPIPSGIDFVTVHSSETLKTGYLNLGIFANYAVNTLPFSEHEDDRSRISGIRDTILALDLNLGYGVSKTWDIGISIPFILKQFVADNNRPRGEFLSNGMTEIRFYTKYRLSGSEKRGIAVIFTVNSNQTQDNPYIGQGKGQLIYNLEFALDTSIKKTALGFNIGYRHRTPGEQVEGGPLPIESQYILSLAISRFLSNIDTKLIGEVFASQPTTEDSSSSIRRQASAEMLLGLKHDLNSKLALHGGVGTELNHAISSPDWRLYIGTNYVIGSKKSRKVRISRSKVKTKPKKFRRDKRRFRRDKPKEKPTFLPIIPEEEGDFPPEPEGIGDEVVVLRNINFAFDSDFKVLTGAKNVLSLLARRLKSRGFSRILIEGHTDSLGTFSYNQDLGKRRSMSIRNYLVGSENLPASKLQTISYGESRPIADNGNPQGRQINRRVVFRIFY